MNEVKKTLASHTCDNASPWISIGMMMTKTMIESVD